MNIPLKCCATCKMRLVMRRTVTVKDQMLALVLQHGEVPQRCRLRRFYRPLRDFSVPLDCRARRLSCRGGPVVSV